MDALNRGELDKYGFSLKIEEKKMNQHVLKPKFRKNSYEMIADDAQKCENHKSQQTQNSGSLRQQAASTGANTSNIQLGDRMAEWHRSQY